MARETFVKKVKNTTCEWCGIGIMKKEGIVKVHTIKMNRYKCTHCEAECLVNCETDIS